ncbi:MAG: HNH endonuclease, partial [Candidatus Eisenbacteria bacterium]
LYAQSLLGHAVPSGDLAAVLDRALDALIPRLEQRRFAATACTRPGRRSTRARHIPAAVRRAVWERDQGQCTFVSESGRRCEARTRLEFDHVDPVARGGRATVDGMRLRCRAHNQYEAERVCGEAFMRGKREHARARAAEKRTRRAARASTIPVPGPRIGHVPVRPVWPTQAGSGAQVRALSGR